MSGGIQYCFDYSADALGLIMIVAVFAYAPFAKTWNRALAVQFVLGFCWAGLRVMTVIVLKEDFPPGIIFIIVPLEYLAYASITRTLKLLLFKLRILKTFEEKLKGATVRKK